MLRPEEVEMLVCGSPTVDMAALKKVTMYDGYSANDHTIKSVPCLHLFRKSMAARMTNQQSDITRASGMRSLCVDHSLIIGASNTIYAIKCPKCENKESKDKK